MHIYIHIYYKYIIYRYICECLYYVYMHNVCIYYIRVLCIYNMTIYPYVPMNLWKFCLFMKMTQINKHVKCTKYLCP